jgi:hypothetical protein
MIALKTNTGKFFFDRQIVINAVGKAKAEVFKKFGAHVRSRAQNSLHYVTGTNPAPPGRPPFAHKSRRIKKGHTRTGQQRYRAVSLLRNYIAFKFDPDTRSVVIGPELLTSFHTVDPAALPALEYGGSSTNLRRNGSRRRINVAAHPFMTPAFKAETPTLPALWRDSVR